MDKTGGVSKEQIGLTGSDLDTREVNIVTLEDPVEYNIKGVNQVQINEKAGMTFANSLRALLRQDPDIIAVGEIHDGETLRNRGGARSEIEQMLSRQGSGFIPLRKKRDPPCARRYHHCQRSAPRHCAGRLTHRRDGS